MLILRGVDVIFYTHLIRARHLIRLFVVRSVSAKKMVQQQSSPPFLHHPSSTTLSPNRMLRGLELVPAAYGQIEVQPGLVANNCPLRAI